MPAASVPAASALAASALADSQLARPFLKWAGGKARLIEQYKPFLPPCFDRYHEPFLGGGALFFYLSPQLKAEGKKAFLSDLNPELVNVYQCVRDRVHPLIKRLAQHEKDHSKEHYYSVRAQLEADSVERAARFIYLNKTCFNGLYRENSKGLFNVPMGRYKKPRICAPELLLPASAALQIADISERPFSEVAKHAKNEQDFVYFDPPYYPLSETSKFTAYSRYRFGEDKQTELRDLTAAIAAKGAWVLASNSDCPFIRNLYSDSDVFRIETITAARSINSKATKRGKITEVLILASHLT